MQAAAWEEGSGLQCLPGDNAAGSQCRKPEGSHCRSPGAEGCELYISLCKEDSGLLLHLALHFCHS